MSRPRPRILIAQLLHETNTFNTNLTRLQDFQGRFVHFDQQAVIDHLYGTQTEMGGFLEAAKAQSWDVTIPLAAACGPSGPIAARDWAQLSGAILNARGTYDGVLLALHGSMVVEGNTQPEAQLVHALRDRLGPDIPIVLTLDMHANLSVELARAADAIFPYETYPHIDHADAALRAASALNKLVSLPKTGSRLTRFSMCRPPMLDAADHGRTHSAGPMQAIVDQAQAMRRQANVVSAGAMIGFPWADVPHAGPSAYVSVLAGSKVSLEAELAEDLAGLLWDSRSQTRLEFTDVSEAMGCARDTRDVERGPLILADLGDNPAAGAYGDSPNLLRAMIEADLQEAVFASIADRRAAALCHDTGEEGEVHLSLGGKFQPDATPPLSLSARVEKLHHGRFTCEGPFLKGITVDMGPMALLRAGGIRIVVASRALAVTDVNLFRSFGLDPRNLHTIALKSRNHFRAAFGSIARKTLLVDAGGIATMQLHSLPYQNLPRPIWPLDDLPDTPDFLQLDSTT